MGPEPAVAREEAEAEPLAGPDREPIEIAAGEVERSYPGPFLDHVGDAEPVPPRNCSRLAEAADGQLVQETERYREIRVQVNGVPGFIRRSAADSAHGADGDQDEQTKRHSRPEHVRVRHQQGNELVHHRTTGSHRVAYRCQNAMGHEEPDGREADPAVSIGDAVLAEDLVKPG